MKRFAWAIATVIVGTSILPPGVLTASPATAAPKPCSEPRSHSNEWQSYGQDLSNSRNQQATAINPSNVGSLKPAWALSSSQDNGSGSFQSTPIEAAGCVFAGTSSGSILTADAATGKVLWQTTEAGGGVFAPTYGAGVVYAIAGRPGIISVVALDASTGKEIWNTPLYQDLTENADVDTANSSTVLYDGLLFVALAGTDSFNLSHPSFFILDAEGGTIVKKTTVIPKSKWLDGYAGGGIWGTGVVDTATKYLYVGTSNPYNKRKEYKYTNAIIKIDMNQQRKTFGQIVGYYRGDHDYTKKDYNTPQCKYLGELQPAGYSGFCGQKDVDFGASPSLYTDSHGDAIVVNLQKSCTAHAVHADTMKRLWRHPKLGAGGALGCAATTAYDDHALYVNINDGYMYALDKDTGATLWKTSYKDAGPHYQPVTVANGVVFVVGTTGRLYAFDHDTGKILLNKQLAAGGQTCSGTSGAGVSIVRGTVYAACDALAGSGISASIVSAGNGGVFAFRLPH